MGRQRANPDKTLQEAAAWFARLKHDVVAERTIDAFFEWRLKPGNDAAYAEVEARWRQADRVRNDPELVRLTETALRRASARRASTRRFLCFGAPLALAAAGAGGVTLLLVSHFGAPTYQTDVGAQQIVRLEDGSVLRLNTDSKVKVRYDDDVRRLILLRGEGFFEVAHDAARPFIVEAGKTQVRALGTKFDVRRAGTSTQVTLLQGRVQVGGAAQSNAWTLRPNEQIEVNAAGSAPRAIDATAATSWTTGRLQFRETPLSEAVAEVSRYSRRPLALEAPALATVRMNGVFDTGDTSGFVSAVTGLFDLQAIDTRQGIVLRTRASAADG